MAAPTTVLTVIKRFPYRGVSEEWSNQYYLTGTTPADSAAWRTLFDALVTQEKTLYHSSISVVGGYGYDSVPAPGDSAVWSVDLDVSPNAPVPGTLSMTGGQAPAGDQAVWIRWGLDRLNSRGKRIYLRKYIHGFACASGNPDAPSANWITAAQAFGAKMRDGSFASSRVITDGLGTATVGYGVSSVTTTRTLKRRGKRPSP